MSHYGPTQTRRLGCQQPLYHQNIVCETSCRKLNAKIPSCRELSSFPFSQGNCLVVYIFEFSHSVVDNSSDLQMMFFG